MIKAKHIAFEIFLQSLGFYCSNLFNFLKYMIFPIFGQILGIILVIILNLLFINNLNFFQLKFNPLNSFENCVGVVILLSLPGVFLILNAFCKYLLAYGSLNSMTKNMLKSGKVYDFEAHDELILKRLNDFVTLWILFTIFLIFFSSPFLWILGLGFFVFFILIFQIFVLEPKQTPFECFKRSFKLVKPFYFETLFLAILIAVITYILLPQIFIFLIKILKLSDFLLMPVDYFCIQLPINQWNSTLSQYNLTFDITSLQISKIILSSTISFIIIGFTLPLRSVCCVLWYNFLKEEEAKQKNKKKAKK